jgi:hypothetical protein
MEEILLTFAEIAAAFAGFASIVVIFRRREQIESDPELRIGFQSMLLSALFVVFFSLLPLVLDRFWIGESWPLRISSAALLLYILVTFVAGTITINRGRRLKLSVGFVFHACVAAAVVSTQVIAQISGSMSEPLYLAGVFALLIASGFSFYWLIGIQMTGGGSA